MRIFARLSGRSGSHPRELPLDGGHLRLTVADLLLALQVLEATLPILALAVRDLASLLHVEVVFRFAFHHGVVVLHSTLVALKGSCHMLCPLVMSCDAVTLAKLISRVVGQRHGHGQLEDRWQRFLPREPKQLDERFLKIGEEFISLATNHHADFKPGRALILMFSDAKTFSTVLSSGLPALLSAL